MNKNAVNHVLFPWIVGIILIIPAILPFFNAGLFKPHDFTHLARIAELSNTIVSGAIPPRWSENFGFGYGMPLFSFYAPLPYYLGVVFHLFGLTYVASVKALFIVNTYFSFIAMFFLIRHFWKPAAAYVGALLFVYAPYRAVDIYVRGALGELYGILFIVVALLCVSKLVLNKNHRGWIAATAAAIGGLVLSHNLMMLIGLPLIIFYALMLMIGSRQGFKARLIPITVSLVLGIGLATYFLGPAILEKQFSSVDALTTEGGNYGQHFVYLRQFINSPFGYGGSIEGPLDGLSFEIGKVHIVFIVISLCIFGIKYKKMGTERYVVLFAVIALSVSMFLMTAHSESFWRVTPFIHYLQFPWRLLAVPLLTIPLIAALFLDTFDKRLVGALGIVIVVFGWRIFTPAPDEYSDNSWLETSPEYIRTQMSTVIPDYIHPRLSWLVMSKEKNIDIPVNRFQVNGNDAELTVLSSQPQSFSLEVSGSGPATVSAAIFDFPGWQWQIDGQIVKHRVDEPLPTMSLPLILEYGKPVRIDGKLNETPMRRTANWVSLISLGLIGLIGISGHRKE